MKIKKLFALAVAMLCTAGMWAQTDVTSQYLTNADFSQTTASDAEKVYGYGKDGTPYGLQAVDGWTSVVLSGDNDNASYPNSGMAGVVVAYGSETLLQGGGKAAPAAGPNNEAGNCFGFFAVWGCGAYYYQDVTLAAGKYTLTFPIYNQQGTQANTTYTGFFPTSGTDRTVAINTTVGSWVNQTVTFTLTDETAGQIRIGYKSTGSGSGSNPHLFFDGVKIEYTAIVVKDVLETALAAANKANTTLGGSLDGAISTAQAVYDNTGATQEEVNAAAATLNTAVEQAMATSSNLNFTDLFLTNANLSSTDGWTLSASSQYHDQGSYQIGGEQNVRFAAPTADDNHTSSEYAFGFECRWSTNYASYNQTTDPVPVGVYTLTFDVENVNGNTTKANYNNLFYIQAGSNKVTDTATEWMQGGSSWTSHTIQITVEEAAPLTISFGYGTGNNNIGSDNTPALYVSHVKLSYSGLLAGAKDTWENAKTAAQDALTANSSYTGTEKDNLEAELAKTEPTTKEGYEAATTALTEATSAFVTAATNAAELAANQAKVAGATYANPSEDFLVNGSFDEANSGWTLSNMGYQSNQERPTRYVEKWQSSALTGNGSATQTIKNLPAGGYVLRATVNTNKAEEGGATLSVNASSIPVSGAWTEYEILYNHENDGDITVTFNFNGLNSNWVAIDGFSLVCVGDYEKAVNDKATSNLATALAAAQTAMNTESALLKEINEAANDATIVYLYQDFILGSEGAALFAAIQGAQNVTTLAEIQAAEAALTSATATYVAAAPAYERVVLTGIVAKRINKENDESIVALKNKLTVATTTASEVETDANNIISTVLVPNMTVKVQGKLGFEKGEYAPYKNAELLQIAVESKAVGENPANYTNQQIYDLAVAYNTLKPAVQNTEDVDAIYNGMFATVAEGANYPDGWTRTNGWGQMQSGIEGDYATAYYNQPGSLQYGNQGIYTMPLAANTVYKFTFAYRSHENGSNQGVTVTLKKDDYESSKSFAANGSTTDWATGTAYLTTQEAGDYVLTLANGGNTWMTNVSLVKAAAEDVDIVVTDAEWGTMIIPFDAEVPQGLTVYSADAVDADNNIQLTEQTEIKANTPYIVKGQGNYQFNGVPTNNETTYTVGLLTGVYAAQEAPVGSYVLQNLATGVAFYQVADGEQPTVKANRAYMTVASTVKAFFLGENADAIEAIAAKTAQKGAIYNVAGQRVEKAVKGLYIINGKKVMVK